MAKHKDWVKILERRQKVLIWIMAALCVIGIVVCLIGMALTGLEALAC